MKRGVMTGRFQPFHNGHLTLAKQVLVECNELVIIVGSAQFNYIDKDPFTAGERVFMIHEALKDAGIDLAKCYIIPYINDENNARWLAYLRSIAPPFDVIYTGNEFVAHLAASQDDKLAVKAPAFAEKAEYNGTHIRSLIAADEKWEHLVPTAVAEVIKNVNGVERIKLLARSDTSPHKW